MRHCSNAVPISKVVKGHMGQIPLQILSTNQSQVHGKNSNRTHKCRIVTTSRTFNGVSTNWKMDVYKYKNYSYAQVAKCPRGGDLLAMPSMATSRASPNQGKSGQNRVSGHYRDRISSHKNVNNNYTVTGRASHQLDHSKGFLDHTCMDSLPKVKVSDHKKVIACTNRIQILLKGDDVVSEHSCEAENTFHAQTDIIPGTGPNLDLALDKVSQSDTSIIISPRVGQSGKMKTKYAQVIVKPQGCQDTQAHRRKDEMMGNDSTTTRSSDANINPKVESTNSTKYDLDLRHKVKRSYKDFLPTCQTLQQWKANTKFKFGFIPLGELKLSQEVCVNQLSLDPLLLHKEITKSGENNLWWTLNCTLMYGISTYRDTGISSFPSSYTLASP